MGGRRPVIPTTTRHAGGIAGGRDDETEDDDRARRGERVCFRCRPPRGRRPTPRRSTVSCARCDHASVGPTTVDRGRADGQRGARPRRRARRQDVTLGRRARDQAVRLGPARARDAGEQRRHFDAVGRQFTSAAMLRTTQWPRFERSLRAAAGAPRATIVAMPPPRPRSEAIAAVRVRRQPGDRGAPGSAVLRRQGQKPTLETWPSPSAAAALADRLRGARRHPPRGACSDGQTRALGAWRGRSDAS